MGREARRVHKDFKGVIGKTWWGYTLPPIPCFDCKDGEDCPTCEGERKVFPKVNAPAWPVENPLPSYAQYLDKNGELGWQMWETTSEGSPMSPIFDTPEDLAQWLADSGASAFGGMTATYDQWLATIKRGWAMSAFTDETGLHSGVEV